MNKVVIMGRITKDLDIKTSQAGTSFISFTVAVNRAYAKQGEEKQTDFISCKAFGKTAENIAKFFQKGSLIIIEGRIQTGSYDKDGTKVYTTDIMIEGFYFTGEKKDKQDNQGWVAEVVANTTDDSDDTLPF